MISYTKRIYYCQMTQRFKTMKVPGKKTQMNYLYKLGMGIPKCDRKLKAIIEKIEFEKIKVKFSIVK